MCLILVFRPFWRNLAIVRFLSRFSLDEEGLLSFANTLFFNEKTQGIILSRGQSVLSLAIEKKTSLSSQSFPSNFDDDDDEKKSVATEKQEEEVFLDRERKKRGRRRSHARARRDGILSRARRTFARDERDVVDFLSVIFVVVIFGDDDDDENNNNNNNNSNKNIEEAFCARAAASESVREPNIFVAPCRGEFATG